MKTLLLLLATVALASAFGLGLSAKAGEEVTLNLAHDNVKAITRTLANGQKQTYNVVGPNKNVWVDSKGKKLPSSNFSYKAPGDLTIKKLTKADAGVYDFEPLVTPAPTVLPPGVHVDPGFPSGIELTVN